MMALRRSSTGMMPAQIISPMYRDMLRQVLQELRADDSFGQSAALPVVSAGDVSIINTPQAFSGSGAGGTALLGGPQFDRVFGLINELTAEVTRVCAMHQLPSTLRHVRVVVIERVCLFFSHGMFVCRLRRPLRLVFGFRSGLTRRLLRPPRANRPRFYYLSERQKNEHDRTNF